LRFSTISLNTIPNDIDKEIRKVYGAGSSVNAVFIEIRRGGPW
jgi:hypothetical protein